MCNSVSLPVGKSMECKGERKKSITSVTEAKWEQVQICRFIPTESWKQPAPLLPANVRQHRFPERSGIFLLKHPGKSSPGATLAMLPFIPRLLLFFLLAGPALLTPSTSKELQLRGQRTPRDTKQDSFKVIKGLAEINGPTYGRSSGHLG